MGADSNRPTSTAASGPSRHHGSRWFLLQAKADGHTTRSVVAEVECEPLNLFRREFGYAAAVALEATLPHVTLWTAGASHGIGVASIADFEAKCVRRLTARERQSAIDGG